MVWPFRKAATPPASKSAAYVFAVGSARSGLSSAGYDKLAKEGYVECVVAFACINRIAAAVASVEPQLYRKAGEKLAKVETHPLLDLLGNPNPLQSGMEFMLELASYHRLAGSAYVFGNGLDGSRFRSTQPQELQLLAPGSVKVLTGRPFPAAYEHRPDASTLITYPVDQVTGRSAILHLKSFNPLNPATGLSPLWAAARSVDIHSGGQDWNLSLIRNGARPSGALVVQGGDGKPATLSDEQYHRLREMIDAQFSGERNAGRPMLLEGGLDWKEMALNPKDMEFLEGKHSAARDIALAFGVPPQLMGIPGDSTFNNYESAKLALWTDTVLPLLSWYLSAFNRWLVPLYGDDLYLWYDEEMIPALEPLRQAKAARLQGMDYLTPNEKRRAMGYDDFAGGKTPADDLFVDSGKIPLSLAGDAGLSEPTKPTPDPAADPNAQP